MAPEDAEKAAEELRVKALVVAIIHALTAGNGRCGICDSEHELIARLDEGRVIYDPADLSPGLYLLESGDAAGRRRRRWRAHWQADAILTRTLAQYLLYK
jgi:hypothetical protein